MPVARKVWLPIRGLDAGGLGAPLDHPVGVLLPHGVAGERAGLAGGRPEQRPVRISGDAGGGDVFIEVLFQIVVTRNLVLLAAFFVQAHPAAAPLHEVVTHFHLEHGVDPREGVDHHADEGAIAQSENSRTSGKWTLAPPASILPPAPRSTTPINCRKKAFRFFTARASPLSLPEGDRNEAIFQYRVRNQPMLLPTKLLYFALCKARFQQRREGLRPPIWARYQPRAAARPG